MCGHARRPGPRAPALSRPLAQVDHHSMLALLWLLGWPFTAVSEQIIRPLEGEG